MTRLPMPEPLRWPSPMRNEPRSCLAAFAGVAIYTPAPGDGNRLTLILRTDEPEYFTAGQSQSLGRTIVACMAPFRGAYFTRAPSAIFVGCACRASRHKVFDAGEGKIRSQNHRLTRWPTSSIT